MEFLTISQSAQLTGKSVQTIRRMIKRKKVEVRRQKTPQGFNYLIERESLERNLQKQTIEANTQEQSFDYPDAGYDRQHQGIQENAFSREIGRLTATIEQLVTQGDKDKENLFSLIKTFQERISVLESQIKLLETPKKKWWQMKVW